MTEISLEDGTLVLVSYETPVAARVFDEVLIDGFTHKCALIRTSKKWSKTTTRHINKWLRDTFSDTAPKSAKEMPQEFFDSLLSVA